MKDTRVRSRDVEKAAVLANNVMAFCLSRADLRATVMAEQFLRVLPQMTRACTVGGPFLYVVSARGLRRML